MYGREENISRGIQDIAKAERRLKGEHTEEEESQGKKCREAYKYLNKLEILNFIERPNIYI